MPCGRCKGSKDDADAAPVSSRHRHFITALRVLAGAECLIAVVAFAVTVKWQALIPILAGGVTFAVSRRYEKRVNRFGSDNWRFRLAGSR